MVKSPAHWQQPASDKGSAAQAQKQLRPGKSDLPTPRDSDWIRQAKESGVGFSGNATAVLHRGPDNPAAVDYRNPPEHRYKLTDTGAATGPHGLRFRTGSPSSAKAMPDTPLTNGHSKPNGHDKEPHVITLASGGSGWRHDVDRQRDSGGTPSSYPGQRCKAG